jgi:hypothetical protein
MAVLSEGDRDRVLNGMLRYAARQGADPYKLKADVEAAIDATDDWIDTNQGAFNAALPEPFTADASALQKTLLFMGVAAMRVDVDFARKIFGEVD